MATNSFPVQFLRATLRPVVRLALSHSVHIQELTEVTKSVFLEEAARALEKQGSGVNTSRLSVITGLRRREVERFRATESEVKPRQGLLTRIIGQWQFDKRFSSRPGKPKVLSIADEEKGFHALVRSVSQDVHPGTVLFELERLQAIKRRGQNVRLVVRAYVPKRDMEHVARLVSEDSSDMLRAIEENVLTKKAIPNLHVRTEYTAIRADALPKVRRWLYREGSLLHARAREFLSSLDQDISPKKGSKTAVARVALGSYSFIEGVTKT